MLVTESIVLLVLFVPLLGAPLVAGLCARFAFLRDLPGRGSVASFSRPALLAVPLVALVFAAVVLLLQEFLANDGPLLVDFVWAGPVLEERGGINFSLRIDGLALFYALVVSGMGLLISIYAAAYLGSDYVQSHRFFAYLLLFMGAMLGTVLADNAIVLFLFWELTGLASFLLIGFFHTNPEARRGARMALTTTAMGGLAMLAGLAILINYTGFTRISDISRAIDFLELARATDGPLLQTAFILICIGAFAKSAQFPFHFWLPNAMTAPAPVSAYLHSATMVKLGVFLVARFFPVFSTLDIWAPLLIGVGFFTMLVGAAFALLSHRLKAILAYSTVAQLGYLIGMYGLYGFHGAATFDYLHILNHVFYKGCLFMVAGIVEHTTGIKDVRELGGLLRHMPVAAFAMFAGTVAMAGLPPSTGFLSKEVLLVDATAFIENNTILGWFAYYPLVTLLLATVLKVAFSLRLVLDIFFGERTRMTETLRGKLNSAALLERRALLRRFIIYLPPVLLGLASLFMALHSTNFASPQIPGLIEVQSSLAVDGLHATKLKSLTLWHGLSLELLLSLGAIACGLMLYVFCRSINWRFEIPALLRLDELFDKALNDLPRAAGMVSRALQFHRPIHYLPVVISFAVLLPGTILLLYFSEAPVAWFANLKTMFIASSTEGVPHETILRTFVAGLIILFVLVVLFSYRWLVQLIALSIIGFLLTFYFVLYRAPDLALTQILVESALLILILLLLARFPRSSSIARFSELPGHLRKILQSTAALGTGTIFFALTLLAVPQSPPETRSAAGSYYLENSVPLAAGTNVVNTILVDFRGFDTLLEISVFLIAALGLRLRPGAKAVWLTSRLPCLRR